MRLLQEKNKSLIIFIAKSNLDEDWQLNDFLENPEELFEEVEKHKQRIQGYAGKYHDYFEIIPVMLYAGHLALYSEKEIDIKIKNKLYNASKIPIFIESIRKSIVDCGSLRRSQTFLGSTVGNISNSRLEENNIQAGLYEDNFQQNVRKKTPYQWIKIESHNYESLAKLLQEKKEELKIRIKKTKAENYKSLEEKIKTRFLQEENSIYLFAKSNYQDSEDDFQKNWQAKMENLQKDLQNIAENTSKEFNDEVGELIQEIGEDLELAARLRADDFRFKQQNFIDVRTLLKWGGYIVRFSGEIVRLFEPVFGLALSIVGMVIQGIASLLKNKSTKDQEAIHELSRKLQNNLKNTKEQTVREILNNFNRNSDEMSSKIDRYFENLIKRIEEISQQFKRTKNNLSTQVNFLNRAYAKRIVDWCRQEQDVLLNDNVIALEITDVQRDFGKQMKIKIKPKHQLKKSEEEVTKIVQEEILIKYDTSYSISYR